jgi:hypothetical protein
MELLGDMGYPEVLVHLETMLVRYKIGARFAPNIPEDQKWFWTHPMVS